jgi:hypothetical protein
MLFRPQVTYKDAAVTESSARVPLSILARTKAGNKGSSTETIGNMATRPKILISKSKMVKKKFPGDFIHSTACTAI